jgi:hypothetical protein
MEPAAAETCTEGGNGGEAGTEVETMRYAAVVGALLLMTTTIFAGETGVRAFNAASPVASPVSCPITQPNGKQPPLEANVFGRGNGDYANDVLWTSLWIWGEGIVNVPPDHVQLDGSLGGLKWAWYRYVPGRLTIEGRRLDAPASPLRAEVPDGYGDRGFQVSGITFPTAGCWEVTGRVGDGSLTFVVLVVAPPATATPVATS